MGDERQGGYKRERRYTSGVARAIFPPPASIARPSITSLNQKKMKKALKKIENEIYYYQDGERTVIDRKDKATYPQGISGNISIELSGNISSELYGDISSELYGNISSGLRGNISELYGNISIELYGNISSGLRGNISELYGNISGLYGDCTDILGNIDSCELTDEEREEGVNIEDLVS